MTAPVSTISRMTSREHLWERFLAELSRSEPWLYHRIIRGEDELVLHDQFVAGEIRLIDVRLMFSFEEA